MRAHGIYLKERFI